MQKFPCMAITALFLSMSTHSALASFLEIDDEAEFADGLYAGLSLGANWADADWDGVASISLIDHIHNPTTYTNSWNPQATIHDAGKIIGSVMLGYQFVDDYLYLAAQISGTFSDKRNFDFEENLMFQQTTSTNPPPIPSTVTGTFDTQSTVSLGNNEFDIDLKPGLLIWENFLVYARAGVTFNKLKIDSSGEWTETNDENGLHLQASDSAHESKNTVGFRVGAGVEYLVTQYLGLSLDYIYSDYGRIGTNIEGEDGHFSDFNQLYAAYTPEVKVTTQMLMAGAIYHF